MIPDITDAGGGSCFFQKKVRGIMSSAKEQLVILKEIFREEFEAKDVGLRGGGYSTLFEVTSIEGVNIPEKLTVLVNFDDGKKVAGNYYSSLDLRFVGNLNVFVMKKKKVLKRVHVTYDQEKFKRHTDTYSLRSILREVKEEYGRNRSGLSPFL